MARESSATLPPPLPGPLARLAKAAITAQVDALFNVGPSGKTPLPRRTHGLFGPGAVARRVHGDIMTMMVGGVTALLLQMLHPAVLAGVWDHSDFRNDMPGRLRRTARFIALTTFGGRTEAEAAIARVCRIHERVRGVLPDGTPYAANDPALLAWVHVTAVLSFLTAWVRYAERSMRTSDQDRYIAEMAIVATALGADPIPRSKLEAQRLVMAMRAQLRCDMRTREVARLVLAQQAADWIAQPVQMLTMQAAIDLLPVWARRMHGLRVPAFGIPLVRAGTFGVAQAMRWAFV